MSHTIETSYVFKDVTYSVIMIKDEIPYKLSSINKVSLTVLDWSSLNYMRQVSYSIDLAK